MSRCRLQAAYELLAPLYTDNTSVAYHARIGVPTVHCRQGDLHGYKQTGLESMHANSTAPLPAPVPNPTHVTQCMQRNTTQRIGYTSDTTQVR